MAWWIMCRMLGSWTFPGLLIQAGCIPTVDPWGKGGERRKFLLCFHLSGEMSCTFICPLCTVSMCFHIRYWDSSFIFSLAHLPFKEPAEKSEVTSSSGSPEVIPVPYLRSLHPRIPSPWADRVATEVTVESLFLDKSHLVLMRTLFHGWKAAASKVQPRSTYHRLIVCIHHVQQTQSLSLSKYSLSLLPSGLVWCWDWASVFPTGCEVRMQEHSGS